MLTFKGFYSKLELVLWSSTLWLQWLPGNMILQIYQKPRKAGNNPMTSQLMSFTPKVTEARANRCVCNLTQILRLENNV